MIESKQQFEKMREYVIDKYSAQWSLLDPAHQLEHFDQVFETATDLWQRQRSLQVRLEEIFLVAYFHDLFTWSRSNHHLLAETFIMTTDCPIVKELAPAPSCVQRVALACKEHRASWTGDHSSDLSVLMSAADRGKPSSAEALVTRSTRYHQSHNEWATLDQCRALAVAHVKEKYGRGGYARIPAFHAKLFAQEYQNLWNEIDAL